MKNNYKILTNDEIQKICGGGYGCTDNSTPNSKSEDSETLELLKKIEDTSGSAGLVWGLIGIALGGC